MGDFGQELRGNEKNDRTICVDCLYLKDIARPFPESWRTGKLFEFPIDAIRKEFAKRVYPHVEHASNAVTQEAAAANRRL